MDLKWRLMKWGVYVGASLLFAMNVFFFYRDFIVGNDISGALNSVIFGIIGITMIVWERKSSKQYEMQQKFNEIQSQWDEEMLMTVKFVAVNTGTFGGPPQKWIAVAADISDKDPERIERAFEEFHADLEYLSRTGDLPDEYAQLEQ